MSHTITRQRSFTSPPYNEPTTPSNRPTKIERIQHSIVGSTNDLLSINRTSKQSARWCLINLILALLFFFGFFQFMITRMFSLQHSLVQYVDYFFTLMFSWNVLTNLYLYCIPTFARHNVILSPKQKSLLGITKENEKLFCVQDFTSTPCQQTNQGSSSPSAYPMRRQSSRASSSSLLDYSPVHKTSPTHTQYSPGRSPSSPNRGQYSPSRGQFSPGRGQSSPGRGQYSPGRTQYSPARDTPLISRGSQQRFTPLSTQVASYSPYRNGSPLMVGHTASVTSTPSPFLNGSAGQSPRFRSFNTSPGRVNSKDDELLDYQVLDKYVKKEEEAELRNRRVHSNSPTSSFWKYGKAAYNLIPNFGSYQLATKSKSLNMKDDDDAVGSPFKNDEVLRKLGLERSDVDIWIENFRKWIAQTVLEPLVKEIDDINKRLTSMGSPDLHLGVISHSSLQSLQTTKGQHLPSLQSVVPYLDVTTNQEYLVSRIKELATGGCLRLYRWDEGGSYKNKPWNPDLPTDAQIVFNLFCTYMDTHLPSNPRYAEGKSFTGLHYLKTPAKPGDKKSSLVLYQSRTQKPYFKVLVEDEICELPKGRNNLFCAIVVFLYYAKRNYHGMLQRVNLGMSGINVLWILDKK
ncbi:transmembrane protein 209-like [Hydractinia symbiolongicarpus]|uniref:transmembrane protein 209-like n=1 Tax=Hydractinia symbiolongicarpus TaxID=13093 RepID=UPI0025510D12|nr:transmembrane protein 209-like [Hydractinia symbiolongicarpus]